MELIIQSMFAMGPKLKGHSVSDFKEERLRSCIDLSSMRCFGLLMEAVYTLESLRLFKYFIQRWVVATQIMLKFLKIK